MVGGSGGPCRRPAALAPSRPPAIFADALQNEEQCLGGELCIKRLLDDLPRLLHVTQLCVGGADGHSKGVPPAQPGVDEEGLACIVGTQADRQTSMNN